jgi:GT2 family glycosyltransferase
MSTLPLVSIVIVSWNAKDYLAECLGSLGDNIYAGPNEIIVVDNASTDGSAAMVQQRFPHVTLISNDTNLGFAKANNIGLRRCRGAFVALVNSDVKVLPDCITTLVTFCLERLDAGLVGPYITGSDGRHQVSCRGAPSLWNMLCRALALDVLFAGQRWFSGYLLGDRDHCTLGSVDILSGCFWLARRRALDQVGLLDESFFIYGEDMDWCKRFRDAGWDVVFVPHAYAIHYGGASSANAPIRFFVEKQKADVQYWRKHHALGAVAGYYFIALLYHCLRILGYGLRACAAGPADAQARYKVRRSVAAMRWFMTGR